MNKKNIEIERHILSLARKFKPKTIRNIMNATRRRAINYAKKEVAKEIAKKYNFKPKTLNKRFLTFKGKTKGTTKIWFGIQAIELDFLSKPTKTKKGVYIHGKFFKNAYINKHQQVYKPNKIKDTRPKLHIKKEAEKIINKKFEQLFRGKFNNDFERLCNKGTKIPFIKRSEEK